MGWLDQATTDFTQSLSNFRKKNDRIYLIEMKQHIAIMQAAVDELDDDIQAHTR